MSKKRIAVYSVIVLIGIISNLMIFNYQKPLSNKQVTLSFTVNADIQNEYQVFYLTPGQDFADGFKAEQCITTLYTKVGQDEVLEFVVPANITYIRFDLGEDETILDLKEVNLVYKTDQRKVSIKELKKI